MDTLRMLCLPLALTACGSNVQGFSGSTTGTGGATSTSTATGTTATTSTSPGTTTTTSTGTGGAPACTMGGTSTLPGVSIVFDSQPCTFTLAQAAAGVHIGYQVVVGMSGDSVVPKPQDAGGCGAPGPSGLIVFESLAGGGQHYCLCDVGLCPTPSTTPVPLVPGMYPGSFAWDGKNWGGPSDTGNPEGAPFPPGQYTLTVSAVGDLVLPDPAAPFQVTGTFSIDLTP
jgi:hypothetical protein